jgi:hypothetical protein
VSGGPSNWTAALNKALGTLVIAALVLFVVEPIFMHVLPGVIIVMVLIGIYRFVLGLSRHDGW